MNLLEEVEKEQMKEEVPDFAAGDLVRVHVRIREGDRERTQAFEGTVIQRTKSGLRENFTVRRVTHNVGVERTFLVHSPSVQSIEVLRRGRVRRARLHYLRERVGKAARVKEKRRE
ncbi:MAG: 50S ribosomal protein L19 [Armatimonadota bacterium]